MMKFVFVFAAVMLWGGDVWAMSPGDRMIMSESLRQVTKAREDSCNKVVAFEYKGKKYLLSDLERFLSSNKLDMCVSRQGSVQSLYDALLSACRDGLASLNEEIGRMNIAGFNLSGAYDRAVMAMSDTKGALCYCLLEKEKLQKRAATETAYSWAAVSGGIAQACVNSIQVHDNSASCPVGGVYVSDPRHLARLSGVGSMLKGSYAFSRPVANNPLVAVFNGYILVVCDGSKAKYIVKPSFSGLEKCQGGQFESLPGQGSTPDGLYLIKYDSIEQMNGDKAKAWGKYRMPLLPGMHTNTYGRSNMYLHGTQDPDKRRSGGCISLGVNIDKFVDDFYKGTHRDMIVVVTKDTVVKQEWNR